MVGRGERWADGYADCLRESCPCPLLRGLPFCMFLGPGGSTTLGLCIRFSPTPRGPSSVLRSPHPSRQFCWTGPDMTHACSFHIGISKAAAHLLSSPQVLSPCFSGLAVPVLLASWVGHQCSVSQAGSPQWRGSLTA